MNRESSRSYSPTFSSRARTAAGLTRRTFGRLTQSFSGPAPRGAYSSHSLWDPTLLDRLHAPLTRYRD
ncbi:MAG: hypothetical protein JNG83_11390 [Opitutaceae bacterium]|nr:hypothetical protein [Opitutaceae bacterium]